MEWPDRLWLRWANCTDDVFYFTQLNPLCGGSGAVDNEGNVYGAEVGPRALRKHLAR